MSISRAVHAVLVGSLAALACFCAVHARGGESYSIVAQSNRFSAATGRRPLAERIAAANLPIIVQTSENASASRPSDQSAAENVAVAPVVIAEEHGRTPRVDFTPPAQPEPEGDSRSPQSIARALWKAATGSWSGTATR